MKKYEKKCLKEEREMRHRRTYKYSEERFPKPTQRTL